MINFGNKYTLWLGAIFIFMLDQLTKILAVNHLQFDHEIVLNKAFSFLRIYNRDYIMLDYNVFEGPFSLSSMWQFQAIYAFLAGMLILGIVWVTNQKPLMENSWGTEFAKSGLFLIMGGIFGNLFDRIFRTEGVVDFIQLNVFTSSYPIFNIADVAIYLGEFCLLIAWVIILGNHLSAKLKQKKLSYLDY